MATYTTNLNLKKPNPEDFYNIADFNGNADIIDNTFGQHVGNNINVENGIHGIRYYDDKLQYYNNGWKTFVNDYVVTLNNSAWVAIQNNGGYYLRIESTDILGTPNISDNTIFSVLPSDVTLEYLYDFNKISAVKGCVENNSGGLTFYAVNGIPTNTFNVTVRIQNY